MAELFKSFEASSHRERAALITWLEPSDWDGQPAELIVQELFKWAFDDIESVALYSQAVPDLRFRRVMGDSVAEIVIDRDPFVNQADLRHFHLISRAVIEGEELGDVARLEPVARLKLGLLMLDSTVWGADLREVDFGGTWLAPLPSGSPEDDAFLQAATSLLRDQEVLLAWANRMKPGDMSLQSLFLAGHEAFEVLAMLRSEVLFKVQWWAGDSPGDPDWGEPEFGYSEHALEYLTEHLAEQAASGGKSGSAHSATEEWLACLNSLSGREFIFELSPRLLGLIAKQAEWFQANGHVDETTVESIEAKLLEMLVDRWDYAWFEADFDFVPDAFPEMLLRRAPALAASLNAREALILADLIVAAMGGLYVPDEEDLEDWWIDEEPSVEPDWLSLAVPVIEVVLDRLKHEFADLPSVDHDGLGLAQRLWWVSEPLGLTSWVLANREATRSRRAAGVGPEHDSGDELSPTGRIGAVVGLYSSYGTDLRDVHTTISSGLVRVSLPAFEAMSPGQFADVALTALEGSVKFGVAWAELESSGQIPEGSPFESESPGQSLFAMAIKRAVSTKDPVVALEVLIRVLEAVDLIDDASQGPVEHLGQVEDLIGQPLKRLLTLAAKVGDKLSRSLALRVLQSMVPDGQDLKPGNEAATNAFIARARLLPDGMALELMRVAGGEPLPSWIADVSHELVGRLEREAT